MGSRTETSSIRNRRVVIVQRRLTHYRVPFFILLRERLAGAGIELRLLIGEGTPQETKRHDSGYLDWATALSTRYFAGGRVCWQPFGSNLQGADLVVLTQENKLLLNYWLLFRRRKFKLAFWGHGRNMQSRSPTGLREIVKRWATCRVDWWFAYTELSAKIVAQQGFPSARVTTVNNAIDLKSLARLRQTITPEEISRLRAKLRTADGPVGVFLGSLHEDKRLNFLFRAADLIQSRLPSFKLLIIGDGKLRDYVLAACAKRSWAQWLGAKDGAEKALILSSADIILNPGLVGLSVLDAFVTERPLFTTDCGLHSPEIAYLEHGVNGIITNDDLHVYVEAVCVTLQTPDLLARLREGCNRAAENYTLEQMTERFATGIEQAISIWPRMSQ